MRRTAKRRGQQRRRHEGGGGLYRRLSVSRMSRSSVISSTSSLAYNRSIWNPRKSKRITGTYASVIAWRRKPDGTTEDRNGQEFPFTNCHTLPTSNCRLLRCISRVPTACWASSVHLHLADAILLAQDGLEAHVVFVEEFASRYMPTINKALVPECRAICGMQAPWRAQCST